MAATRTLVETEHVALRDIACASPRSGPGALRGGESSHFVLVRRGAFSVHLGAHLGRKTYVADACTALISWADTDYRISHPGDEGDDCLVVELSAALADEALAPLRRHRDVELRLSPRLQAMAAAFAASVRQPDNAHACTSAGDRARIDQRDLPGACDLPNARACDPDPARATRGGVNAEAPPRQRGRACPLSIEESSLTLMQAVLGEGPRERASSTDSSRRLARRAIEALHRDLAESPSVSSIAAELGCSPFHLMRAVRAELGTSLRGYRVAARIGAALHRLAEGEQDLTRLALELGFASHAHLTSTFVRVLGAPPRALRAQLHPRARTFLEARRAATS